MFRKHHFHSEKMFHNYRGACLQRCFIAVNILIANTSCGRSILSCDHYNDKEIKPCWYISNILLGLAHTSELQSEYFPALAVQSVSKCLKVFSGILVAELFSVYVFQRLSVCILIINQMFGLWQKNHIIYMYTLSLQIFSNQFYPYLKLKMARHRRGEVPSQKKKKRVAYFKLFETALAIRDYFWYFKLH